MKLEDYIQGMLSAFSSTSFIFLSEKEKCPVILTSVLYACETQVLNIKEEQIENV
jgi:hypothetical protein